MSTLGWIHTIAATAAEVTSRLPGTENDFGWVVAITSVSVMAIGAYLIQRYMPRAINGTPVRFRRTWRIDAG